MNFEDTRFFLTHPAGDRTTRFFIAPSASGPAPEGSKLESFDADDVDESKLELIDVGPGAVDQMT